MNPKKLLIYKDVYEEKQADLYELIDFAAWRTGMYHISAIQNALHPNEASYPEKPFVNMTDEDSEADNAEPSDIASRRFADFVDAFNKKFREKDGEEDAERD